MKHFKVLFFVIGLIFCFQLPLFAQRDNSNNGGDIRTDSTAKKSFLIGLLEEMAKNLPANTNTKPIDRDARIAYEFKRQKIYPSSDALDLIFILNPWLDDVAQIPDTTNIKMPVFPWLEGNTRKKMKDDYKSGSKPDDKANQQFNLLVDEFDNNINSFVDAYNNYVKDQSENDINPQGFLDTLSIFAKSFLPFLKNQSGEICKSKMDYINSNLSLLTDNIKSDKNISDNNVSLIFNIIRDFFLTNNFKNNYSGFNASSIFLNASYPPKENSGEPLTSTSGHIENKALKCRVYIYDMDGNVINKRFNVYFAPYVIVYNLENCNDVTDCLLNKTGTKDAGPASTAAASIANNSNWALFCVDNNDKQVYLVNEKYNYQNIVNRDDADESSFKILIIFHGN